MKPFRDSFFLCLFTLVRYRRLKTAGLGEPSQAITKQGLVVDNERGSKFCTLFSEEAV